MINKVIKYINRNNMINKGEGIILGVSGGADSVCLLTVLNELKGLFNLELYVVHVNHSIRGIEADNDEKYVESLCSSMGIWFRAYRYDVPSLAEKNGLSEEEMGRNIRYNVFEKVREEVGASKIAVAHNSNDSVETILYNMCRGTGIKGVCGIPPVRGNVIRPIMCCSRNEIEEYLNTRNIRYKIDSTNLKGEYTRNKIRLELIPYISENINTRSQEHILNLAEQLSSIEKYINNESEKAYLQSVGEIEDEIRIDTGLLKQYPDIIRQEVIRRCIERIAGKLKDITSGHISSVMELIDNITGKQVNLPYNIICENIYGYCRIRKRRSTVAHFKPIEVIVLLSV
ncbi:MAG: tRNA lysidine(34) synthetase TilS [Lachnospiraceae bacterium]|nr:tRNA lysidine(34) synthetase TilS [Lachnospiraceae bacterium]